jgi:hypothetical protein
MRVQKRFNFRIDKKGRGRQGHRVFRINPQGGLGVWAYKRGDGKDDNEPGNRKWGMRHFPHCSIRTKYKQMKQRYELEHFSGRHEEKIKHDCYEMMRVSNMLAAGLGRRMKSWGR